MREVTIDSKAEGKKIDRVIRDLFPNMPASAMHKAFRKKDIKVNGIRVKDDHVVQDGDKVEIYIIDEILDGVPKEGEAKLNRGFTVVYEDQNLMIVNKEQGIPVHPDREQTNNTLIDYIKAYLQEKGEYNPKDPSSFPPSLCHRLDRNTGGLLIIAKNSPSLETLLEKIKLKEIKKFYLCKVTGKMPKKQEELKAYLEKDEKKSRVFISDKPSRNSQEIITRYRVLSYDNDISSLEVELITGRTHQIRAHLAHIGHPIVGDGKYGLNSVNRALKAKYQALWAYKLVFDIKNAGHLNYLRGRSFEVSPEFKA
ncbi:MAG: RluA family pseudouridine synthase [Clostridia bacterium]|nr:RluA family pseudouridine synthase [Clostridia bacterium]